MTRKKWMMTQSWHDVLFLHWPVDPAEIRKSIPRELELDTFSNKAWIGIVLFKAQNTRPRFLPPIPGAANFLEVNVRTYVRYKKQSGVYFFSLDASSKLAVEIASFGGFLPYRHAKMAYERNKEEFGFESVVVEKKMPKEKIQLHYRVSYREAVSTSLEQWLTERYCLWTKPGKHLMRLDIGHTPWKLKYVKGFITKNTMAPYIYTNFQDEKPIAHYAESKKVRFFPPIIES